MEKNFCCDGFESYYELSNLSTPNFRIMKAYTKFSNDVSVKYTYAITIRYAEVKVSPLIMVIKHCPFCGTELNTFYQSDDYVNAVITDFV